jgi:hypothetical protein
MFAHRLDTAAEDGPPSVFDPALTSELRQDFGRGLSRQAAETLVRAHERGLAWDVLARAVADGLAQHYGPAAEVAPPPAASGITLRQTLARVLPLWPSPRP